MKCAYCQAEIKKHETVMYPILVSMVGSTAAPHGEYCAGLAMLDDWSLTEGQPNTEVRSYYLGLLDALVKELRNG